MFSKMQQIQKRGAAIQLLGAGLMALTTVTAQAQDAEHRVPRATGRGVLQRTCCEVYEASHDKRALIFRRIAARVLLLDEGGFQFSPWWWHR